ncbi:unnamed protein product [Rotaria sp. Silwood1]|nr:unnamed protein product [Rotaria sp. Silwood1]CAF1326017.1 unnamed protein product [Rotaria sp. Silwood1]
MSDENKQSFNLQDESDLNVIDNEINELRLALERGCDLGSVRTIGKCRPLTDDLRLAVWKTCLDINDVNEYDYIDSDVFDLPEQNLIREDVLRLVLGVVEHVLLVVIHIEVDLEIISYFEHFNSLIGIKNGSDFNISEIELI